MPCPGFDPDGAYVSSVLAFADCHALTLGEEGYRALGGALAPAFTALATIFVALIGYRLLLGRGVSLRDGVGYAARLGLVVALAAQWPAYRVVVFDVFAFAPEALARVIMPAAGLGAGDEPGLAARVDGVVLALLDSEQRQEAATQSAVQNAAQNASPNAPAPPQPPSSPHDNTTGLLTLAQATLLITALAGLVGTHTGIALLLALGPLFVATALFAPLWPLFAGWLRGLATAALAALAVALVLAVELAILAPQVASLHAAATSTATPSLLPAEIAVTTVLFALAMVVVIGVAVVSMAGIGVGVRAGMASGIGGSIGGMAGGGDREAYRLAPLTPAPAGPPRARRVAEAMAALDRRDAGVALPGIARRLALGAADTPAPASLGARASPLPLGVSGRRSTPRASNSAQRREEGL